MKKTIVMVLSFLSISSLSALSIGIIGTNGRAGLENVLQGNGHNITQVANTSSDLADLDALFLLRTNGDSNVRDFVFGGGLLVTEWTGADWAINTGNLLNASIYGGGFKGNDLAVTFTPEGDFLAEGIGDSYSANGATQFFRDFNSTGPEVDVLATRPGGAAAIVGGAADQGYVLAIAYDWGDYGGIGRSPGTNQLILNALNAPRNSQANVPEPSSILLLSIAVLVVLGYSRKRN
ncbi:PEP-CTERM sorting domain-containing protein [Candidatus Uabimicrobium amorphum]|uniref:PEP-CTERM protein-sorting domain-containing protein n=1 Tax=Uabimicrobium amorphum TaxID=2596890 RepID=A0A5S9IMC1_UABAM|nr:PEP-CTERM sorting domain-containing protein [Candidatus Uabimicrobium amorphum]BBM84538.1 hypothetical protein UABAM_02899 [Candidatus Uabimicrobium amorphum]